MAGQPKTRAKKALAAMEAEAAAQADAPISDPPDTSSLRESAGNDKPPRKPRRASAGSGTSPTPTPEPADRRPQSIRKIEEGLQQTFVVAGIGVSMFDAFDGQVIALNSRKLARAWADLAHQSPAVRKALESLLNGSAWGAAVGQTAMIALPILVRHGYAPVNMAAMAAANGVEIPIIETPSEASPADVGAGDVGPFVPPSDEVRAHETREPRHPADGAPLDEPPIVPPESRVFPRPDGADEGRA